MGAVGLFYVGAVLFLNAVMLLGRVEGKSAAPLNFFVGTMQVAGPFYLIFTHPDDPWLIFSACGLFLFGFTYLYVGIGLIAELDSTGVGWYSLFVSIAAIGYSLANFLHFNDYRFGVIWLEWSFLWFLFWVLLGLKRNIAIYTGWVTLIEAWQTAAIPGFLILSDNWSTPNDGAIAIAFAIGAVAVFAALYPITRALLPPAAVEQRPAAA